MKPHTIATTAVLYYELSAELLCSTLSTLAYINGYCHLDMSFNTVLEIDDGSTQFSNQQSLELVNEHLYVSQLAPTYIIW